MKVTIKDVAKAANVSITTVSRVLNGQSEGVGESTKEKVLQIAKQLNYTPNIVAKSMVTNRTQCIGLLIPDVMDPFFQNVVRGVEDSAYNKNYSVYICNTDYKTDKFKSYIDIMLQKNTDGMLITGSPEMLGNQMCEVLSGEKMIILDRFVKDSRWAQVYMDNEKSAYEATSYLVHNGHKKIGVISGPKYINSAERCLQGYKRALSEHRIFFDESLIYYTDIGVLNSLQPSEDLIKKHKVTAIFCLHDQLALGVYKAAESLSLSIPDDVSVIGFGDIELSLAVSPSLTTVRQPWYNTGFTASEILMNWIKFNTKPCEQVKLSNTLIVRDSVKKLF